MPSTFRWRCSPIHSSARQNSPKSAVDRQAGLARRLPVAHRPVELLLLVPGDEGVAQQRGDVVADRAVHGVLEVEDAGVRRRRPSGCAASSRGAPRRAAGRARSPPAGRRRRAQVAARPRRSRRRRTRAPRTSRERAPARAAAGRRRRAAAPRVGTLRCQRTQGGDGVAHQRVGTRRSRRRPAASCSAAQVEPRAEVVEQQEAVADVGLEHARRVQAGLRDQAGDVDERPHVLLRRRRVHHDDAAAAARGRRAGSGESWRRSRPAAGSRRSRPCAARPRRARRRRRAARRIGPGDGGRRGGRDVTGGGDRRSRCDRARPRG